jgi:STE24 endopeptidase
MRVLRRVERQLERLAAQDGAAGDRGLALGDRAGRRVVAAEDEDGYVLGLERAVERARVVGLDDRDAAEVVPVLRAADLHRDELVAGLQRDGRGSSAERPPLVAQLAGLFGREPSDERLRAHLSSLGATKLTSLDVNPSDSFAIAEIERARSYHRPRYLALLVDWALQLGVLTFVAFGPGGDWLWSLTGGPWWARTLELTALVIAFSTLVRLPLSAWRGWIWERRWSFSTQSFGGWLVDMTKGLVLGALLTGLGLTLLVWSARAWPTWWPVAAAVGAATLTVLLSLLAPLLFERVFNRFEPLADEGLARDLRSLSERAGVPVKTTLVADASRRTTKHNAYVSGLGPTRRLVLYDTLLRDSPVPELRGVVAHELGHRRFGHVARGSALAALGAAGAVLVLRVVFQWDGLVSAAGATGPGDPRCVPLVLLVLWMLEIGALPFETWLSRRWERVADRFAVELTDDPGTMERMHRRLALANLADLDPPRPVYLLLFTHPTPPERIAAARMGT